MFPLRVKYKIEALSFGHNNSKRLADVAGLPRERAFFFVPFYKFEHEPIIVYHTWLVGGKLTMIYIY